MSRILCVEDEPALRRVLVEELALAGYETMEATNGMDGLSSILEYRPDLVLCDITMPKMNGHDLLRNLRIGHPEYADLPFVFLSALADKADVIEGRKLGADDYLTKPVDLDILLSTVESRLTQVQRMRELKQSEMDALRNQIIETLPHEFRTPLNAILGYAEMIIGEVLGPIGNRKYLEYVENIFQGGKRLHFTVEKLLALSEIACGKVKVETSHFDLVEVVEGLLCEVRSRHAEKQHDIQLKNDMPYMNISIAHNLMAQALHEILDNACKFTRIGGRIEVLIEQAEQFAIITISDTGIGMENTVLKNITSAFSQGEAGHTRSFEGLGLGLALAEKSISLIDGTIQFESARNEGTRVTICAPIGDEHNATATLS